MPNEQHEPTFNYTVDGEHQSTSQHEMTPVKILEAAGIDPKTHYLVQIIGKEKESYKDNPNTAIHMHENMKFISVATGPTPVSSGK